MSRRLTAFAAAAVMLGAPCAAGAVTILTYQAVLSGANEGPPNASPATGFGELVIDPSTNMMGVVIAFYGLLGPSTDAHIYCCTTTHDTGVAGAATQVPLFVGFPTGVTSGGYVHIFNLGDDATYNPAFEAANGGTAAGAEAALLSGLAGRTAYVNVNSTAFPTGEIRGFLSTPEPATWAAMLLGFGLAGGTLRRRRKAVEPITA